MTGDQPIAVFITAGNLDEAQRLATMLIEERLAACAQILPEIQSIYRWQGKLERAGEVLIIVKTVSSRFEELEQRVRALHSYETPEIVAFKLTSGSAPYLEWLTANTTGE
jgi:periplasmic divalent cation tolerance protein